MHIGNQCIQYQYFVISRETQIRVQAIWKMFSVRTNRLTEFFGSISKQYMQNITQHHSTHKRFIFYICMKLTNTIQFKKKCKIGQYEYDPQAMIGLGHYGKVYKGTRTSDKLEIAVKIVDLNLHPDKDTTKFVKNELKIHQILKHQRIINCLQIYKKNNIYYFITEYLQEGDLDQYIKLNGPFQENQALRLLYQIIQGLMYLKEKKVIHRDIKPANIFLKEGNIKIADFGLSVIAQRDIFAEQHRIGTPRYMSPQTLRQGIYSFKCDVWSLGSIFIQMVSGQAPLSKCNSFSDIVKRVSGQMIPQTINISKEVKGMLDSIFTFCSHQRISIQQLYCHPVFNSILNKNDSLSTTEESQIQVQDISFSIIKPSLLSAKASVINGNSNKQPRAIYCSAPLIRMFQQFMKTISLKSGIFQSLNIILQRVKSQKYLRSIELAYLIGKVKQKIEELSYGKSGEMNCQVRIINLSNFKNTPQSLESQALSF